MSMLRPSKPLSLVILCLVSVVIAAGCGLRDLRPDEAREGVTQAQRVRGEQLIAALAEAHGGLETFRAHRSVAYVIEDTWLSWMEQVAAMPWSKNEQRMRQTVWLGSDNSRLEFLDGDARGTAWGIQHWATYTVEPDKEPMFEQDDTIKFWLPTLEYFFEAPFRLHEADVIYYLDDKRVRGETYHRVFLSWGSDEPQDTVDQYVAWIDADTGRLAFLHYTVRDMFDWIDGWMAYRDYEQVQGIWVARTIAGVEEPGGDDAGHRLAFEDVVFGVEVPDGFITPRPDLVRSK
jgi:hypothetical protein